MLAWPSGRRLIVQASSVDVFPLRSVSCEVHIRGAGMRAHGIPGEDLDQKGKYRRIQHLSCNHSLFFARALYVMYAIPTIGGSMSQLQLTFVSGCN